MNEIRITGTKKFNSKDIKILEGGFGENCKVVLARDIANIHNMDLKDINRNIKRLIEKGRIKNEVHFIDLKESVTNSHPLLDKLFDQEFIRKSANIFILSERGYSSLIKYMDDNTSWNIHDKFSDEYFTMREVIRENKLNSYMINDPIKRAEMWIEEQKQHQLAIEVKNTEIKHKTKVIDNLTEGLDGVVLRVACTEYVNKVARETGKYHASIYTDMYLLLGRNLKIDLKHRLNKYKEEQRLLVKANIERNSECNLIGDDRLRPITLKESRYNISMIEYICGVLGKGHELMEVMAKSFEIGIEEIIAKYKFYEELAIADRSNLECNILE